MEIKKYELKTEYKMFTISSFMAHTTANIFKVVGFQNEKPIIVFKNSNGNYERKKRLLNDKNDYIVIPLKDCILKADSETGNFTGNAKFNFLNTETEIREQLKFNMISDFKTNYGFNMVDSERNYINLNILNNEVKE
ncbi:MAG: hypothetical protein ACTSPU_09360 [Promethearchaeota archaeon]